MEHLRSTGIDESVPRRLAVMVMNLPGSTKTGWHSHQRGQLLYAQGGLMVVDAEDGTWAVPADHALLIAPELPHKVAWHGCTATCTAYIQPAAFAPCAPETCRTIRLSPLLDATLRSLAAEPALYDLEGRAAHLEAILLDEIARAPEVMLALPLPTNRGLRKLCRALIDTPSIGFDIDEWASTVGVSRSTLTRNFRAQTGMSFAEWRRRVRMLYALTQQAEGVPLSVAAKTAGYRSANALRDMMRRAAASGKSLPAARAVAKAH
jgi:AraC-like DNA-binding protein